MPQVRVLQGVPQLRPFLGRDPCQAWGVFLRGGGAGIIVTVVVQTEPAVPIFLTNPVPTWFRPGSDSVPPWFRSSSDPVQIQFRLGSDLVPTWLSSRGPVILRPFMFQCVWSWDHPAILYVNLPRIAPYAFVMLDFISPGWAPNRCQIGWPHPRQKGRPAGRPQHTRA